MLHAEPWIDEKGGPEWTRALREDVSPHTPSAGDSTPPYHSKLKTHGYHFQTYSGYLVYFILEESA